MLLVADKTMGKLYAIRGGQGHGVYEKFHEAIGAGWYQKQPYGNAASFSQEERDEAHAWIDGREPFPEGRLRLLESKIKEQHIFVKLLLLTFISTIFALALTKTAYFAHGKLECPNFPAPGSVPCIYAHKIIAYVNEYQRSLHEFVGAQLTALVGMLWVYIRGLH